jgi:hypothetical protein
MSGAQPFLTASHSHSDLVLSKRVSKHQINILKRRNVCILFVFAYVNCSFVKK